MGTESRGLRDDLNKSDGELQGTYVLTDHNIKLTLNDRPFKCSMHIFSTLSRQIKRFITELH